MGTKEEPQSDSKEIEPIKVSKFGWKKVLKAFMFRVPIGFVLIALLFLSGYLVFKELNTKDATTLSPAVNEARSLEVKIEMCNKRVDEISLDVRAEELRLQKRFEEVEKASDVRIVIDRIDCVGETPQNNGTPTTTRPTSTSRPSNNAN